MSRAFDTVDRNLLMNDLESILEEDELHKILLENGSLVVKCGDTLGKEFVVWVILSVVVLLIFQLLSSDI